MLTPTGCRGRVARLCAALDSGLDAVLISRPEHVFYFSNLFPLTPVVALSRGFVRGTIGLPSLWHFGAMLGFTAVACLISTRLLARRLRV